MKTAIILLEDGTERKVNGAQGYKWTERTIASPGVVNIFGEHGAIATYDAGIVNGVEIHEMDQ